jgi:hypothetical protein
LYEEKYYYWIGYASIVHFNANNASEAEKAAWSYIHLPPEAEDHSPPEAAAR